MIHKQIIPLFLFIFTINCNCDATSCRCKNFENNIYQLTTTVTNQQPFYTFIVLLSNGIYYETSNIANGQNAAELASEIPFGIHNGFYSCLPGNKLRLTSFGYIYKQIDNPLISTNGATGLHYYDLQFLNNDNRQCTGLFSFALYTIGTNPFDSTNNSLLKSTNNTVTGQLFNGRDYELL